MQTLVSIVVPAYNEERTIGKVLDLLEKNVPYQKEIVVVDDGSKDRTRDVVRKCSNRNPSIHLIALEKNSGKTAALKRGFAATAGDVVIVQDADLEYDPSDIPSIVEPILQEKADVVYGSRFLVKHASRVLYFRHYMANRFLTFLVNLFTDMNFSDVETGYKAFRGEIIHNMVINAKGFGFEIEVTAKVKKLNCRVYEVPISYYGRTYAEGKKIGLKDGIFALFYIFKYNLFCTKKQSFTRIPNINPNHGLDVKDANLSDLYASTTEVR